jgi:hypothetical protein
MTRDDVRSLADELARFLRDEPLAVPTDLVVMLRDQVIGEPRADADGIHHLPPWRLRPTTTGVELTWTIDLGHDSGVRRWFVATADRAATGWIVRGVSLAHAHRR